MYFFLNYSRILDVTLPSLHLPLVIGLLLYAVAALAGSIQRSIATTPGKLLIALTGIMIVAALFGAWPGGSLKVLSDQWSKSFPFYFTVVGLCISTGQIARFLRTIAIALTVMCVVALWRGDNMLGRLMIDNSRFADPNDLAIVCLLGLACLAFLLSRKQKMLSRLAYFVMFGVCFYALIRTGSRGAFLGLVAGIVYLFWKASAIGKLKMATAVGALVFFAAIILPPEVYVRYAALFSDEAKGSDTHEALAAEGSSEARLHLLWQSLTMTITHPLLGVGPGNFAVVENEMAKEKGFVKGSWHETHNMYTQISSENGVVAAVIYIAVLLLALKATNRTMKIAKHHPNASDVYNSAFWLRAGLMMFAVSGFFLSVAYSDMLPLFTGLAFALELATREEIDRKQAPSAPAAVKAPMFPPRAPAVLPAFATSMRR